MFIIMLKRLNRNREYFYSFLLAISGCLLAISMLIWPKETYTGASYGLELWATVLVPSLLPFFIITEILLSLGIVKTLGELLEPLMRPVFNLPGTTSFVLAVGFTSGFPIGAILTRRLCEEGLCSIHEGERLVAFTNNSSPLFILAAVGIGMFHDPTLGLVLALSHYISNLLIGIILGLSSTRTKLYNITRQNVFKNSLRVFLDEQRQRNPLGKILGDSIRTGINNITLVGGFIVFFAVLTNILSISGILNYMFGFFIFLLKIVGIDPAINTSLSKGFWEITLGLKDLSRLPLSFTVKAVTASIILGWSGLSIQTQVISFLSGSGIRPRLYYSCRVLQALLAGLISLVLSLTSHLWSNLSVLPVFSSLVISDSTVYGIKDRFFYNLSLTFHGFLLIFTVMIIISLLITQIGKIKNKPQLW